MPIAYRADPSTVLESIDVNRALPLIFLIIIAKPSGCNVESSQSMVYLGGIIAADGHNTLEINRRIELVNNEFTSLQKVWSHANLSVRKKIAIYQSLIVPKLMYALDGIWLNQCQRNRLDSFHAGCIRRIVQVQHAY